MQGGFGIALNNTYVSFYHLYLGLFTVFFLPYNIFTQINSFPAGACGVKTSESISVSFFEVFVTVMTLNQNYTNVFVVSVFEDTKM